jgi:hypothetical protein
MRLLNDCHASTYFIAVALNPGSKRTKNAHVIYFFFFFKMHIIYIC